MQFGIDDLHHHDELYVMCLAADADISESGDDFAADGQWSVSAEHGGIQHRQEDCLHSLQTSALLSTFW